MNRGSIDLEDGSEIEDGTDYNKSHLEDSSEVDMSGFASKSDRHSIDYSAISEESLDTVLGAFSPRQPTTYRELVGEYNKIRNLIESEKRTLTAKKVTLRFEINELQKENAELRSANESLQQKNVSLQQENERLLQDAIQKSETLMNEMYDKTPKGGTLKRRTKRKGKVSKRTW